MRTALASMCAPSGDGYADAQEKKEAWKESGHSWLAADDRSGARSGKSIADEEGLKHEWKSVGRTSGRRARIPQSDRKSVEIDPGSSAFLERTLRGSAGGARPGGPSQSGAVD